MAFNNQNTGKKKFLDTTKAVETIAQEKGKLPPQAVEIEQGLLGAMLIDNDAYDQVCEIMKPEFFYNKQHQYIYEAIQSLSFKKLPINYLTVAEELKKNKDYNAPEGDTYLSELTNKAASQVELGYFAEIVYEKFLSRDLIRIAEKIEGQAFDETTDVKTLMEEAEGQIFEINQRRVKREVTKVGDVVNEVIERTRKASQQDGGFTGLRTGFTDLDKITNGWQPATLNIIAARPAMGKTAFVLSMARNMALQFNAPIAFFSLEMSNLELVNRLVINVSEIEGNKIKSGHLTPQEWDQLYTRTECLNTAPIYIDDTANMSISELSSKARRLKADRDIKCIIIDYLQLMNASGMSYGSREQEVSIISRSLKGLAKDLDIPIIALSQLNRGVEAREAKTPQLSDLRESGAIEQDADIVAFIHRPEYYKILEEDGQSTEGMAQIIIAKHRSGSVGTVKLKFEKELIKFSNYNNFNYVPAGGYQDFASKTNDPLPGGMPADMPPASATMDIPAQDNVDPF